MKKLIINTTLCLILPVGPNHSLLVQPPPESRDPSPAASSSSLTPLRSSSSPHLPESGLPLKDDYDALTTRTGLGGDGNDEDDHHGPFAPYTDDPEVGLLQTQRQLMDEQDVHLDRLSHSINRQRDLSIQIGDELEVHTGLLEGLDHDLDGTDSRMRGARRRLDRVARGAKENSKFLCFAFIPPSFLSTSPPGAVVHDTDYYYQVPQ